MRAFWVRAGFMVCAALAASGCGDDGGSVVGDAAGVDTAAGEDTATDADTAGGDAADTGTSDDVGTIDAADSIASCPGSPGCACTKDDNCYSNHCVDAGGLKVCAAFCKETEDCDEGDLCVETKGQGSQVDKICVPEFATLCAPCESNNACAALGAPDAACLKRGDDGAFCGNACGSTVDCPTGYLCETATDVTGKSAKYCVLPAKEVCACSKGAIAVGASTTCYVPNANGGSCTGSRSCLPAGAPGAPTDGGLSACSAPAPATETCDGIDNDCNGAIDDKTCDDNNPCTTDSCNGASGCKHSPASNTPCDADGSVCTENDSCVEGVCTAGSAKSCDDGNPCTTETCDAQKGCLSAPGSGEACNADDNPCTLGDICKEGVCEAGQAKACDSGDVCTLGKCDIATGKCKYSDKDGEPCNDGNPCTGKEACIADSCKGSAIDCDDGSPCTADSCDATSGCVHKANDGPCNDGDGCTEKDACAAGACVGQAIDVTATCDDGDDCTADTCDPKSGCVHAPQTDVSCDDGNVCTLNDSCQTGKCVSGQNVCGCTVNADCEGKEDGNLCNGTLFCDTSAKPFQCKVKPSSVVNCDDSLNNACQSNSCNPKLGKCEIVQGIDGKPCDADGSVCTKDDQCKSGTCLVGAQVKCDDDNPCTDDACDPKSGCSFTPNTNPCNADDDACTVSDACVSGGCAPGKSKNCDDGEFCTDDTCAKDSGKCLSKPRVDKCDDSNLCTTNDACGVEPTTKLYTCVGGETLDCNDKNPCTTDQCDAVKGCSFSPVTDGAGCEDGNACTIGDICAKGACEGKPLDVKVKCDDGNPCTIDACAVETGCTHKADDAATCDDGNACTKNDYCKTGTCVAGVNTCGCSGDSDCTGSEDGNFCNGTLYCDKSQQPFQCKVNPGTVVKCDDSLNSVCQQNACEPSTGKCLINKEKDGTPCKADDNVCTSPDACADGACKPGPNLDCDDKKACTSDSCDPKAGCVATPLAGPCNDGDACTELDSCQGGTCKGSAVNEKVKCDDDNQCTLDTCDQQLGCKNTALDAKGCDDGNACTQNDACVQGVCKGGVNTCGCNIDADCKAKEDDNLCNGTLYCDATKQCKINPVTVVNCDTSSDNFCKKTACVASTGKCVADVKDDATPCDADASLCTTQDACTGGACKAGSALKCDDKNPCTADSCDPKQGCIHTAQGGDCDADGDACTVGDSCQAGKCTAGKSTVCDDKNPCTSDSCDNTTGKCVAKELIQSCSDDNACTSGDVCGKDTKGAWTCISGKTLTCNDGNSCTEDACDQVKGCSNTVNTNLSDACYTFDAKTRSKGECKDGVQLCQADGTLGNCKGDKGPGTEICDGKDNNCDGITDEGCAPTAFSAREGNASIGGTGTNYGVKAFVGHSQVAGRSAAASGGKLDVHTGFYAWVLSLLGGK